MKTSKKLLSLFLAMVMIITSCSVGLSAFAADLNPTDSNNEYWSDGTNADAAFDSLNDLANAYVPMLLNIDKVKSLIEDNLKMKVTDKTTISDVVAGASPLLLGLFTKGADRDSVLNSTGKEKGRIPLLNYSYLENSDSVMSFWSLYKFCQDNKNAGGELGEYASKTLPQLEELLNVCPAVLNNYDTTLSEAYDYFEGLLSSIYEVLDREGLDYTLENFRNVEIDGVKASEIKNEKINLLASSMLGCGECCISEEAKLTNAADFCYVFGYGDYSYILTPLAKELLKLVDVDPAEFSEEDIMNASFGDSSSLAYSPLMEAAIIYSGLYTKQDINNLYITKAQIETLVSDLKGGSMTGTQFKEDYLINNCPFSSYARDYIINRSYAPDLLNYAQAGDVDAIMNIPSSKYPGKTYIEEVNRMLTTKFVADNFTDAFGVYETAPVGIYVEISAYFENIKPETYKHTFDYNKYAIPSDLLVEAVNNSLNNAIGGLFGPDASFDLSSILNIFVDSDLNLYSEDGGALKDLWLNLYNEPIETIVKLIPVLVILIDEVVVPFVFNEGSDEDFQQDIMDLIGGSNGFLYKYSQECELANGPATTNILGKAKEEKDQKYFGIGSLAFDLNKAIPAVLHWLVGDTGTAYKLVGYYTEDIYSPEGERPVPKFFNFYLLDKLIHGAHIGTGNVTSSGLARSLYKSQYNSKVYDKNDDTGELTMKAEYAKLSGKELDEALKKASDSAMTTALGVDEIVTELATFAMEAIDEYVAEHKNDARYNKEGEISQRGLNNIFVALPQVIDNLGKKFVQKYSIKSDWTYTYSGKISSITKAYEDKTVSQLQNTSLENFKATQKLDDPSKVLDEFVNIFIGDWINALLDLVNDLIQDKDNKITSKIGLVQNLLAALGGFGETSIITDLVNGLFQLKRCDVPSFTLKERDRGFVGFSNESGFFLLSNIQFTDKASNEQRGIIPLIMKLVEKENKTEETKEEEKKEETSTTAEESKAPLLVNSSTDYNKLLSEENVKASQELVETIDKLLSSLLANTSLNGFDWDSTDNLLSSLATFASAYLGGKNTNDIVLLLNDYLYFVTGESKAAPSTAGNIGTAPTADGNVDASKVYTSANLSNLVIQTYSLIENIVDYLFYNANNGLLKKNDPNKLIADALYGIISPDAVAIRISSYAETSKILLDKDNLNWNSFKVQISNADTQTGTWKKDYLKYGFKDGDKTAFYDALGESMSGVAAIIGALLSTSTGYYRNILHPVLSSIANATGATGVMTPDEYEKATDSQKLIKGIVTPIGNIISKIYNAPLSFVLNVVKGVAGVLDDKSVKSIIDSAINPINGLLDGVVGIVNYLSPTFAKAIEKSVSGLISIKLPESNIIVTLVNKLIADINVSGVKLGTLLTLPIIDWNKLASAKSAGEVLLLIYGYVVDAILDSTLLTTLIDGLAPGLVDIIKNLSASQILKILKDVLMVVQSPTEVYWTFSEYANKLSDKFTYPTGITAQDADKAVDQLDDLVANVFPLLNGLGVTDIEGLSSLVNDKLYTNKILTTIATALYGALNKNSTVVQVLGAVNIDVTTKGIAAYLTDKSFGATYSSAAATLKKAKSWDNVKTLNWGFKDGSAKAQTGFINGLAAILRPVNDILSIFLAEGSLDLSSVELKTAISSLKLNGSTNLGETDPAKEAYQYGCKLSYILKDGVLTLKIRSNVKTVNNNNNVSNVLKIDLNSIIDTLQEETLKNADVNIGTNGYESAIIPLLEAFMCKNVKTYKQYKADYNKAKDNLLIDVLKPVFGLVNDVLDAPFDTVTKILPNVAYFIDSNGVTQLLSNLLAPITSEDGILGALDKNGLNIDTIIKEITGKSLGKIVTDALGIKVKFNLEIHHLEKCNLQDIILPLVKSILKPILKKAKLNIVIPDFDFATIASHGTIQTVKSAALNKQGKYTTKRVKANQGEVLVAVLRYVADALIKNASTLNKVLCGIDAIKKNATIKNVIASVFNTMGAAHKDDIVRAVFYLLTEDATDSYFDYRNFKYKNYSFSFGEMDEDFCRTLAPMLDGLVSGLLEDKGGLLGLIGDLAYKDSVISSIACGLYGAIEGVNISDDIGSLTSLLAMTDIDFTTGNVASLLTNADYGRTYESAASTIKSAGSWAKVNKDSLKWGVKDRDTFLNALCAVLRPIYGVLDVLLNDAALNIFNLISIPGSDGYTSTIVPLLEAFGCYNIKTQYQYREDCFKAYDSILLDIINPVWDKVEDILNAPIEMLADILPNLSLFFANDGLLQIIDNLLTPVSALLNALKPIVNINDVLDAVGLDINGLLAKAGLNLNIKLDIYDLKKTLEPLIGSENVVNLLNKVLGIIKIKGASLGIELPQVDWYKLASHGEVILNTTSQVATYGSRIYVKSDQDETLIAVLRFLIDTINYKGNYDAIVGLVSGLLGDGVSDSVSDMIGEVLGMLQGDSDEVIAQLVDLLQSIAG